jgi:hypothetical protein
MPKTLSLSDEYVLLKTTDEKIQFIAAWKRTGAKRKREKEPNEPNEPDAPQRRRVKRRVKCKEEPTLYPQRERTLDQVVQDLKSPVRKTIG